MMKQSIFEIDKKYTDLLSIIEESDGEITEELAEQFDITIKDVEEKFYNYAYIIQKLQGECKTIDDEIERLNKLKSVKSNSIKSLEKIVLVFLPKYGNRVKAGQGHKYVFDLGKIKLENRYTKPVEVSEELVTIFNKIVELRMDGREIMIRELNELLSSDELKILNNNIDKYTQLSFDLNTYSVDEMKRIFNILENEEISLDYHCMKVKIKNADIKEDLKNGIEIPGARINEEFAKLNIK